jgi:hypothetical protein
LVVVVAVAERARRGAVAGVESKRTNERCGAERGYQEGVARPKGVKREIERGRERERGCIYRPAVVVAATNGDNVLHHATSHVLHTHPVNTQQPTSHPELAVS